MATLLGLTSCFGGSDCEKPDPNPYHLTLSLNKTIDSSLLKATFAEGTLGGIEVRQDTRVYDATKEYKIECMKEFPQISLSHRYCICSRQYFLSCIN